MATKTIKEVRNDLKANAKKAREQAEILRNLLEAEWRQQYLNNR